MKVTVLGSGTSVPHPSRTSSGYFVETDGCKILLDCSASIASRMAAAGLTWHELDAIWISHFHLDHVGGLPAFLAGTKHAAEMKDRTKPLQLIGPVGSISLIERFDAVNNYRLLEQPFPVEIVEVEPLDNFMIAGRVEAVAMKTPHTPESLALHISGDDRTMVYTADTGFDETIAAFANRVDLLVIECSFPKNKPAEKHLELAEAMYIIRKASPKHAVLTHLYPDWDKVNADELIAEFSPPCRVTMAFDGLEIVA